MLTLFKRKSKKTEQTCFCYCPTCRNELIASRSFKKEDEKGLVYFKCATCSNRSIFDFGPPVPILVSK